MSPAALYLSRFQMPRNGNDLRVGYKDYVKQCLSRAWHATGHMPVLHKQQLRDFPPEASL